MPSGPVKEATVSQHGHACSMYPSATTLPMQPHPAMLLPANGCLCDLPHTQSIVSAAREWMSVRSATHPKHRLHDTNASSRANHNVRRLFAGDHMSEASRDLIEQLLAPLPGNRIGSSMIILQPAHIPSFRCVRRRVEHQHDSVAAANRHGGGWVWQAAAAQVVRRL